MRSTVMRATWPLDGDKNYPRKPVTWEEVAQCVEPCAEEERQQKHIERPAACHAPSNRAELQIPAF